MSDDELVETCVCLANGSGGTLLVGVEDDGRITGSQPRHEAGRTDPDRLRALIANQTQPSLRSTVEVVEVDGCDVVVIVVDDEPRAVGTASARYVRRALGPDGRPSCVPYHLHEMQAHEIGRGAVD